MLVGELLEHNATTVYSYPEPRQSLRATCVLDVDVVVGSPTLTVSVETRNRGDATWTTLGTFSAVTGTGVHKLDVSGAKELVRWAFGFSAGSAGDSVRFLKTAVWRPDA